MNAKELRYLNVVYISCLLMCNILTNRFGSLFGFNVSGNPILYIICFLICDYVNEKGGEEEATNLINNGLLASFILIVSVFLTSYIPYTDVKNENAYRLFFGNNIRIVVASLLSYYISNRIDIRIFNYIKKRNNSPLLRKSVSTFISQFFDSVIFCSVSFIGIFGIFDLIQIMCGSYFFKFLANVVDIPFYLLLVRFFIKDNKNS